MIAAIVKNGSDMRGLTVKGASSADASSPLCGGSAPLQVEDGNRDGKEARGSDGQPARIEPEARFGQPPHAA